MKIFNIHHYCLIFFINYVPGIVSMVDGTIAAPNQFKYLVSIWRLHDYLCGGVIIDRRHVLTAGQCVYNIHSNELWIVTAITKLTNTERSMLKITKIWFHPNSHQVIDFGEPSKNYWTENIAIIKVADEFHWRSTIEPIPLNRNDKYWPIGEECEIPGWQSTERDGHNTVSLIWAPGKILSKEEYMQRHKNPLPNAGYITSSVLLYEDAGSPIICEQVMTGLIVQGGETINEPSTILKISDYIEFITAVITNGDVNLNLNELAIVVSVWYNKALLCGGVIIDSTRILTASHCIPKSYQTQLIFISYISHIEKVNGKPKVKFVPVENVIRHFNYRGIKESYDHFFYTKQDDIAILKLGLSLQWSPSVRPAVFAAEATTSRLYCHTFRWISYDYNVPIQFAWSSVVILDLPDVALIPNQFVIADGDSRSSSCLKDHGNPVICNGIVIGIVINSLLNTGDWLYEPTIVLDIIPYIRFIDEIL